MDVSKYITRKKYNIGEIISEIISDLYNDNKYENVLFIRTCTTGDWLDKLLIEKHDVDRILYYTDKVNEPKIAHNSTIIIHSNEFENHLVSLGKTYDLICFDTFHEYEISSRDFRIISSLLNETGILISHDCYPWNNKVANPYFIPGNWCGETYIAFINLAYNNPNMFYANLNLDTGIGIASKIHYSFLSNKLDRSKQKHLLNLHKNSKDYYKYFKENSKDIINAISS